MISLEMEAYIDAVRRLDLAKFYAIYRRRGYAIPPTDEFAIAMMHSIRIMDAQWFLADAIKESQDWYLHPTRRGFLRSLAQAAFNDPRPEIEPVRVWLRLQGLTTGDSAA